MNTTPYIYQRKGARFIQQCGGKALLADEMGLGKSIQSLLYAYNNPHIRPIVIVCPAVLKYNWQRECFIHFSWPSEVLDGRKASLERIKKSNIVIVNYDILHNWQEYLTSIQPKLVILDECSLISNYKTIRSKATKRLCKDVPHVVALSGTPLTNRPAELWHILHILYPKRFPSFYPYAYKFCLPSDAPILMADLTEKAIKDVRIGDEVIGWGNIDGKRRTLQKTVVKDVIQKQAPLQKVLLSSGDELVCTPDHLWSTGASSTKFKPYRIAKEGHNRQGRGAASSIMRIFHGTKPKYPENNKHYMLGYIHGFWRGDGHCIRNRQEKENLFKGTIKLSAYRYSIGAACKDIEPIRRLHRYLKAFKIKHRFFRRSDGLYAICSMSRKDGYEFIKSSVRDSKAWWAGFLGGIYDSEGSGACICQHKKVNPVTFSMIEQAYKEFDFDYAPDNVNKVLRMAGGRQTLLRFWNIANPTLRRKLVKYVMAAGGRFNSGGVSATSVKMPRVVKITPLEGVHTTYTLTTGTGNYVAYGHGSKNCDPKPTPFGMNFSGSSNLDVLHNMLTNPKDGFMIRRRKEDVLKELPNKHRGVIPIEIDNPTEYKHAEKDFLGWLAKTNPHKLTGAQKAERLTQMGYLKRLAGKLKLKGVIAWIDTFLEESDEKLIVFAVHREIIKTLHERYKGISVVVDGSVTGKKRQTAVDQFQKKASTRLFIGNINAAGKGITLTAASTLIFVELGWSPGEHDQAESRHHRIGQTKKVNVFYIVGRNTIETDLLKLIQKKQKVLSQTLDGGSRATDIDVFDQLTEMMRMKAK